MTDPLRVALLTAKMSPAAGGLAVSVPGLAHGIERFDDVEMHVLGVKDPADPAAAQRWGPRVMAFPPSGPAALQYAPAMAQALRGLAPDVVDVQGIWTWPSKISLDHHRRSGTPYVVTPRGMLDPWARANSAWKKRFFAAFAETAHLRGAHCLRATAEMEAQHFRDVGLVAPIAVVPNAVEITALAPRPHSDRRRALFLSRIHPKKGIDLLLEAWAALEAGNPDWDLVIAGIDENGHEARMKARAAELGLRRVSFPGAVHGAAKDQLYRSADLFVLPTHAENFGLVIAEALVQEVPVITTTNAPWAGMEAQGCGWWIPLDVTRLTDTMALAMAQPGAELHARGARGRVWVEQEFSPSEVAERMRSVYLWVAGRGERPDHVYQ